MNTLNQLSGNINVFVNFFNSINRLFCQIRWLDRNLRNSSGPLLAVVGAIVLICYVVYASPEGGDMYGIPKLLVDHGPLVIVCVVIGVLLARRYREGGSPDSNLNSVMFGNPSDNPLSIGSAESRSPAPSRDIEMGTKIDRPPPRFVQPAAVKY